MCPKVGTVCQVCVEHAVQCAALHAVTCPCGSPTAAHFCFASTRPSASAQHVEGGPQAGRVERSVVKVAMFWHMDPSQSPTTAKSIVKTP